MIATSTTTVKKWRSQLFWFYSLLGIIVFTISSSRRIAYYDFNYIQNIVYRMTLGELPFKDFDLVLPAMPYLFVLLFHVILAIPINISVYFATCALIFITTHALIGIGVRIESNGSTSGNKNRIHLLMLFGSLFGVVSFYPNYVYDSVATTFALAAINQFLKYLDTERKSPLHLAGLFLAFSTFSKYNMGGFLTLGLLATLVFISLREFRHRKIKLAGSFIGLILPTIIMTLLFLLLGPKDIFDQTIVAASKFKNLDKVNQFAQYYYPALIVLLTLIVFAIFKKNFNVFISYISILILYVGVLSALVRQLFARDYLDKFTLHIFPNTAFTFPIIMLLALHRLIQDRRILGDKEVCILITIPLFFYGTFLSQGWYGSSYSLWPMLGILALVTVLQLKLGRDPAQKFVQISGILILIFSLIISMVQGVRLNFVEYNGMRDGNHFNFELIGTATSSLDRKKIIEIKNQISKSVTKGTFLILPAEDSIESFGSTLSPWGRCLQYTIICPSFNEKDFIEKFTNSPPEIVVIKIDPQIVFNIEPITSRVKALANSCFTMKFENSRYLLYFKHTDTQACLKSLKAR